jgi:hypothetical protein
VVQVLCLAWRSCPLTKCGYFVFCSVEMSMVHMCYLIYVVIVDRIQLYRVRLRSAHTNIQCDFVFDFAFNLEL